ncbi:MAG: 1-acyl-sn-glycerol-3-phosphate acyltransferase [Planctomycetes bacterium]|jgi:1-acyl-sn-glycerol-3-phosphate acyltransferase|nr:1-acyl-sn-glycerol-3-phosphate acyltransferase [Planctomycetota bacterium]
MIAGLIRLLTGAQGRWIAVEPVDRPRIYFANHQSNLDAPVIWASLPAGLRAKTRPVAARDYWEKGPLRRWLAQDVFRVVLIERSGITPSNNPMTALEAALEAGDSLILFPEGTRQTAEDAGLNPFKPGLWHLARKHPELELVPVWLENLNRILPKGEIVPLPLMGSVTFGAPLALAPGEDRGAFMARAQAAVLALEAAGEEG